MIEKEENDSEEMFEHHRIVADKGQSLLRIDKFLQDKLPNASRNKIQQGIRLGFTKVNGKEVKPNYRVHPGDDISVNFLVPPREDVVVAEEIPLDIIYEDSHLLIVNKPAGMVVHPAYQNWNGTLVNALTWYFGTLPEMKGNVGRPGLVHRIDKDTSGLLVIAKTEEALEGLASQFFHHTIERTYLAVTWGVPDPPKGTINKYLSRSEKDRRVTIAHNDPEKGKHAITHYEVLEDLRYVSLVKCNLETGRTHQIRAHMTSLGHPLFNDAMYGGDKILKGTSFSKYRSFVENSMKLCPRQALHAKSLGFIHPVTRQPMSFSVDLPVDMKELLEKWRNYVANQP